MALTGLRQNDLWESILKTSKCQMILLNKPLQINFILISILISSWLFKWLEKWGRLSKIGELHHAHHFHSVKRQAGRKRPLIRLSKRVNARLSSPGRWIAHPPSSIVSFTTVLQASVLQLLTHENISKATNKKVTHHVLWKMTSTPWDEWRVRIVISLLKIKLSRAPVAWHLWLV